jgi:hypothetical protein
MFNEIINLLKLNTLDEFCFTFNKNHSYYYILIHYQNKNLIDYSYRFGNNYMKLCLITIRDQNMIEQDIYNNSLYSQNEADIIFTSPKNNFIKFYKYNDINYINLPTLKLGNNFIIPSNVYSIDPLKNKHITDSQIIPIYYEGIIVKHYDHQLNKYRLIKLQTLAYQFYYSSLNIQKSIIPSTLNIFKGMILLYQYNKLYDFINQINMKIELSTENFPYNAVHIINGMMKCLSLELFILCNNFWLGNIEDNINFESSLIKSLNTQKSENSYENQDLYINLPKIYKEILYILKGIYYENPCLFSFFTTDSLLSFI